MNTILVVYHTLRRLIKTQNAMKIKMRKKGRRDRRLDVSKLYLVLDLFTGIMAEACSFFHY